MKGHVDTLGLLFLLMSVLELIVAGLVGIAFVGGGAALGVAGAGSGGDPDLMVAGGMFGVTGLVASVLSFVLQPWFFLPFVLGLAGVVTFLRFLGIVTGNIAEAPVASLDELQLAKRNSARSIGYITVFSLMFIPYLTLIAVGSAAAAGVEHPLGFEGVARGGLHHDADALETVGDSGEGGRHGQPFTPDPRSVETK